MINALECQKLQVRYFPGAPRPFKTSLQVTRTNYIYTCTCVDCVHSYLVFQLLQIQVAHFEPDTVTLVGQGYYPRISFSLPRPIVQESSESLEEIKNSLRSRKPNKKKQQVNELLALIL